MHFRVLQGMNFLQYRDNIYRHLERLAEQAQELVLAKAPSMVDHFAQGASNFHRDHLHQHT
jgi:hypothetical protein